MAVGCRGGRGAVAVLVGCQKWHFSSLKELSGQGLGLGRPLQAERGV